MRIRVMVGAVLLAGAVSSAAGAVGPVDVSADLAFMSKYTWRGMAFNDEPVMQSSVTVGLGGFSANVWTNMDFTDYNGTEYEFNEVDYTLDYTLEFPLFSVSLGAMRYTYSGIPGWDPTTELYLGLESGIPGSPALMVYQDVDNGEGTYLEAGVAQSFPVAPFASLEVSAMLGWGSGVHNRYMYEVAGMNGGLTDVSLNFGLPIGIGEIVSVTPTASIISVINSDLRRDFDKSLIVFGISASAGF